MMLELRRNMWQLSAIVIQGLMFGIEFPPLMEIDDEIQFAVVLDVGFIRLGAVKYKEAL